MDAYTKNILVANLVRDRCDDQTSTLMDIAFQHNDLYTRGYRQFYNCRLNLDTVKAIEYTCQHYNYNVYNLVKRVDVQQCYEVLLKLPNVNMVTLPTWEGMKYLIPTKKYEIVEINRYRKQPLDNFGYLQTTTINWLLVDSCTYFGSIPEDFQPKVNNVISFCSDVLKLFPKVDILSSSISQEDLAKIYRPLRAFIFTPESCDDFYEPHSNTRLYVTPHMLLPKLRPREELETLIIYSIQTTSYECIVNNLQKFPNLKNLVLIIEQPLSFLQTSTHTIYPYCTYLYIYKEMCIKLNHMRLDIDVNQYVEQLPKFVTLLGITTKNVMRYVCLARLIYYFLSDYPLNIF